jgi:hypothetical protein
MLHGAILTEPHEQYGAATNFPTVGRWRVTALPSGWMYVANFGIKQMTADPRAIPANVSLGEDILGEKDSLPDYIAAQGKLIEHHLLLPKMAGPQLMPFSGAEEAYLFFVRHTPDGAGNMLHVQRYVRSGDWVGIITLTTPEAHLQAVRPDYEAFVKGLRIIPPVPNQPQP